MKFIYTFITIVFTIHFVHAQQNIFPLSVDTPRWCMVVVSSDGGSNSYSRLDYTYQKDTIVDTKNYSKISLTFGTPIIFLIRNDNKKTFIRRLIRNQTPLTFAEETLLYDFNMSSPNDSILVTASTYNVNFPNLNFYAKFITADSILFNNKMQKRIKVEYWTPSPRRKVKDAEWIEGYGDLDNPFYDYVSYLHVKVSTMALDIKNQRVYQNSTIANGCTPKRVSVYDFLSANISIYPNPVAYQLNVDITQAIDLKFGEIVIQDMVGKIIYKQAIDDWNTPLSIDVSNFNAGMYIVSLQSNNKRLFSKKIIKSD